MIHNYQKYRNTGVWVNLNQNRVLSEKEVETVKKLRAKTKQSQFHKFPSKHEYHVYSILRSKITRTQEIVLQYPVKLIESSITCPKGKYWKVDFAVFEKTGSQNKPVALIEAKGFETSDFLNNLVFLEAFRPELFQNLLVVYPKKKPSKGMIHKMSGCPAWNGCVYTLKEFQQKVIRFGEK